MRGICECLEEIAVARHAADILGRAVSGAADQAGIVGRAIGEQRFLVPRRVLPAVAHVVEIVEAFDLARDQLVAGETRGGEVARARKARLSPRSI